MYNPSGLPATCRPLLLPVRHRLRLRRMPGGRRRDRRDRRNKPNPRNRPNRPDRRNRRNRPNRRDRRNRPDRPNTRNKRDRPNRPNRRNRPNRPNRRDRRNRPDRPNKRNYLFTNGRPPLPVRSTLHHHVIPVPRRMNSDEIHPPVSSPLKWKSALFGVVVIGIGEMSTLPILALGRNR